MKPAWEQSKEQAPRVCAFVKTNVNRRKNRRARQHLEDNLESYRLAYRDAGEMYGDDDVGMVRWYFELSLKHH